VKRDVLTLPASVKENIIEEYLLVSTEMEWERNECHRISTIPSFDLKE